MAVAGVASAANSIWLSDGGGTDAVGGLVVIPLIGGTGQIDLWLDHHGATDSVSTNGTGYSIGFDGFGQTRNNDTATVGSAHFVTSAFNDTVTGVFGSLVPNDPDRSAPGDTLPHTFGSASPGFGYVFAIVHNGPITATSGYFGDGLARKADEIIITGTSQTVLPDAAYLLNTGGLNPTWVEVTDYNGTISTEILLPVANLSKNPTSGQVNVEVLPEPASLALLLIGGLAAARRRR
jgi:hypothetical protein